MWFIRFLSKQNAFSIVPNVHHSRETFMRDLHHYSPAAWVYSLWLIIHFQHLLLDRWKKYLHMFSLFAQCCHWWHICQYLMATLNNWIVATGQKRFQDFPSSIFYFMWHTIISSMSLEILKCMKIIFYSSFLCFRLKSTEYFNKLVTK